MRIIKTKVYTINEHPNKDLCFEWIRNNWHDLNQHSVDEVIESIKALNSEIGGNYDYLIGDTPSRGEFITFKNFDTEKLYMMNADSYPLTGCCWDVDVIQGLKENNPNKVLGTIHQDTEYVYSDEGLNELCEANNYEFTEEGKAI